MSVMKEAVVAIIALLLPVLSECGPIVQCHLYTLSLLAQLSSLCQQMDRIWEEGAGEVVLYNWQQFLANDTLDHLFGTGAKCELPLEFEDPTSPLPHWDERALQVCDGAEYSSVAFKCREWLVMYSYYMLEYKEIFFFEGVGGLTPDPHLHWNSVSQNLALNPD